MTHTRPFSQTLVSAAKRPLARHALPAPARARLLALSFFGLLASLGPAAVHAQTCAGNVTLTTQAEVNAFACSTVTGNLSVTGSDIADLTPLASLTSVGGSFTVTGNASLTSLAPLAALTTVSNDFEINSNNALTSLAGLTSLTSVGNLFVVFNSALTTCSCGLAGLVSGGTFSGVSGSTTFFNNASGGSCNSANDVLNTACTLPVELVSFDARTDEHAVLLNWITASETNNASFEIAHRYLANEAPLALRRTAPTTTDTDAAWIVLGFVNGHGTTTEAQSYTFRVTDLPAGTHRFRLKQRDYDGAVAYSPEVEVRLDLAAAYQMGAAYPNPFHGTTRFEVALQQPQHVTIRVYDMLGRQVAHLFDGPLAASTAHRFTVEASAWPSGLYLIRVAGESFASTQPLSLVH